MIRSKEIRVFNSVTGSLNPITWADIKRYGFESWRKYPNIKWAPSISFITNQSLFNTNWALVHLLPAYLIDLSNKINGEKPRLVSNNTLLVD